MRHLTIVNFGTFLGVNGNRLIVKEADGRTWETLLSRLRTIRVAKKGISVSSNLVIACASRGIRLYFVDWQGIAVAAVSGLHNHAVVNVRKAQFKNLQTAIAFDISKEIGICQVVFPKMFNCSEPLKLRTGALPLRFATPGYFQNMNRGRNVAEFDSNAPTVQGGIPMTVNVNREGSACALGPFAIQFWARRACPGSATGFRRACSPIRGH